MSARPPRQSEETLRAVYAYVAYRIGPGPDAEDIVSQAVERGLRYRSSYDPAAGTPIAWLIGIANNCLADARPEGRRRVDGDVDELIGSQDDFARRRRRASRPRTPRSRTSTSSDRELLALRYGADLSARQIGRVLGMRTNAVEVALHRALGRLRRELEERRGSLNGCPRRCLLRSVAQSSSFS